MAGRIEILAENCGIIEVMELIDTYTAAPSASYNLPPGSRRAAFGMGLPQSKFYISLDQFMSLWNRIIDLGLNKALIHKNN